MTEAVTNLFFSVLFVKAFHLGINGVLLGSTVCFLCGRIWMDAFTLYRHWFKKPYIPFMMTYLMRLALCALLGAVCYYITSKIFDALAVSLLSWLLCCVLCIGLSACVLIIIYRKSDEFNYLIGLIGKVLHRKQA